MDVDHCALPCRRMPKAIAAHTARGDAESIGLNEQLQMGRAADAHRPSIQMDLHIMHPRHTARPRERVRATAQVGHPVRHVTAYDGNAMQSDRCAARVARIAIGV